MLGGSQYYKHPLFHTVPWKMIVRQKTCFVGLYFLEEGTIFPQQSHQKTPNSFKIVLLVSLIYFTMLDTLVQKSTALKMEGRESLREAKNSSHATKHKILGLVQS